MAIEQLIADCLALDAQFRGRPRGSFDNDRTGLSPAQAAALNASMAPLLQHLVDELHRTEPAVERVYELRTIANSGLGEVNVYVLLCSDRRVVFIDAGVRAGIRVLAGFPHGVLDVQNRLMRLKPELQPGPPPILIWPRLAGDDDVLDLGVRHVMAEPSPSLRALMDRVVRGALPSFRPVAPHRAATAAAASPPGWHTDPTGRHQHRWWDGGRWTETVADGGVVASDPI